MNFNTVILDNIKKIRQEKGFSQYDLADRILVSQPVYSKLEAGITSLDIERLLRISVALDVSLSDLFPPDETDKENTPEDKPPSLTDILQQQQQQQMVEQLNLIQLQVQQEIRDLKASILGFLEKK